MVDFKELETLLKEVVRSKKLSASKITKLQEMAMKLLKYDTKLVSMLYRTHKSLSSSQKVSSLYVFDALARAARHQANKHSLPVQETSSDKAGNAGTFLFKLEGILDGLIEDMIAVGTPEATEKTRKVLEIWTKANTFPADVLSRLLQSVNQGGQGPTGETTSTSVSAEKGEKKEGETLVAGEPDKTAVLAILARMGVTGGMDNTNASGTSILASTTATTTVPTLATMQPLPPAPIEPHLMAQSPMALIQQLTQQNLLQNVPVVPPMNSANFFATQLAGPPAQSLTEFPYPSGPVYMPPNGSASGTRRYQEDRDDPRRAAHTSTRYDSPPGASGTRPSRGYDRAYEDSYGEGKKIQRRDTGGSSGSRWDRPRRDQGGSGNGRSRSRSPPARSDPRDPRLSSPTSRTQPIPTFTSATEALSPITPSAAVPPRLDPTSNLRLIPSVTSTLPNRVNGQSTEERIGLDSFDFNGFDATSAESWRSFGNAYEVTHGRQGTHEELIAAIMELRNGAPIPLGQTGTFQGDSGWQGNRNNYSNQYGQYNQYNQNEPSYSTQQVYLPPAQRINTWETREQDDIKRGGRQVGHGSYDGGGAGHAVGAGRWQQTDAIVLCGSDE